MATARAANSGSGTDAMGQNGWDGGGGNGLWSNNLNWGNNVQPAYGTLFFDDTNNGQTTMTDDNITAMNQLNWSGTQSWILNQGGSTFLSLFDLGGNTQAKIENFSTGSVTINLPITFAATAGPAWGEINAVNGSLIFGSGQTLTLNGSAVAGIRLFGANSGTISTSFNGTTSASGKYFATSNVGQTINIGGAFTSGDFYLMNAGTLRLNSGGTFTTSALRLGGDLGTTGTQNLSFGATFALTNLAGGQSFSSIINTVANNTSGALLIDSRNTSNTNTLSSSVFLDSDLTSQTAAGGTLLYQGGSFDLKNRTLTIGGAGNTTINETLGSSLAAGGSLVKIDAGTLILQGTSNNYSGANSNSLNGNATQINGGTLGIYADTSLGLAPLNAYNNIQFTGSSTLQDTANNIALATTRNILISNGVTASVDSNGNTFTINGVIDDSGTGGLTKVGAGTVKLNNAANAYGGVTTISAGTLEVIKLASGSANSSIGNSINSAGNLVIDGGTLKYTGAGDATGRSFTVGPNGATIDASGSGALSFTATGASSVAYTGSTNRTFTLAGTNTGANTFNPVVADPTGGVTSFVKSGTGTWNIGATAFTYTGITSIDGGILAVDNNNVGTVRLANTSSITINSGGTLLFTQNGATASTSRLRDAATMTLNGGTFNTGGYSEANSVTATTAQPGLGALTLSSSSIIDLANGASVLAFANSSAATWSGTLSIYNWSGNPSTGDGTDRVYFGTTSSGLTGTQLSMIQFFSGSGTGALGSAMILNDGEIVPVPEASTWIAGTLALGAIGYHLLRRKRGSAISKT